MIIMILQSDALTDEIDVKHLKQQQKWKRDQTIKSKSVRNNWANPLFYFVVGC